MPKPTPQEIRQHRDYLRRQERYEQRYVGDFYKYLELVYATAATTIEKAGPDAYLSQIGLRQHETTLRNIYVSLYSDISLDEARLEYDLVASPEKRSGGPQGTKDIIDDLAGQIPFTQGGVVKLWRELLREYLEVRIATRIQQVTETTVKHITQVIQQGLSKGDGPLVIARALRKFTGFNRNRSIAIARTETVTAGNQGKYLAAQSSDLVLEKRWIPTLDGKTRHSHREFIDSEYIPLEAVFVVSKRSGGSETARYPGDESLSAENVVNCRCGIGFRPVRNADGSLRYKL